MIIRRDFEAGHYHVAADAPFQDASLSWQARGVMGYLFTKPPDWTPRMYDIVNAGPCKKHKIKSIFKELEAAGYLHRRKIRTEGGTFDWEVVLFDHPRSNPPWSESTPEAVHPGANGGANHNDVQSDSSLTIKTEREPAREEALLVIDDYFKASPKPFQRDKITAIVDDLDRWRAVLEDLATRGYSGSRAVGYAIKNYENPKPTHKEKTNGQSEDDPAQQFGHYYDVAMRALGD